MQKFDLVAVMRNLTNGLVIVETLLASYPAAGRREHTAPVNRRLGLRQVATIKCSRMYCGGFAVFLADVPNVLGDGKDQCAFRCIRCNGIYWRDLDQLPSPNTHTGEAAESAV